MKKLMLGLAAAGAMSVFAAELEITVDRDAKPIRDARSSTCNPMVGYAGCTIRNMFIKDSDQYDFVYATNETSRVLREAGAWFQRMWGANDWFATTKCAKEAFEFWKANGFHLLFTLECWGDKQEKDIRNFVKFIADNHYESVVAGFEFGNESFYSEKYPSLAPRWERVTNDILKMMPKVKLGICIAENFEENPDIKHVRERMLADKSIPRDSYFAACDHNRYSAQFVMGMSNVIKKITHVIYHAYGAETPYSCSYYGFKRFRAFAESFPELKDKKYWLTEVRLRSDEDNRCQRIFRETLLMGHYALMCIVQPDFDGFNYHQLFAQAGGVHTSNGKMWSVAWKEGGGDFFDRRSPYNQPHYEIGHFGVGMRILAEAILEHPLLVQHGTTKGTGEDTFYTSANVTDQVYRRRRAIKEGKKVGGFLGFGADYPKVEGEMEYVVAFKESRNEVCLMMVNTKSEPVDVKVTMPGWEFAGPVYYTLSCPGEYVDTRDVPGEGHPWKQLSYEVPDQGWYSVPMAMNDGIQPDASALKITIKPHTLQAVTSWLRKSAKADYKHKDFFLK